MNAIKSRNFVFGTLFLLWIASVVIGISLENQRFTSWVPESFVVLNGYTLLILFIAAVAFVYFQVMFFTRRADWYDLQLVILMTIFCFFSLQELVVSPARLMVGGFVYLVALSLEATLFDYFGEI